MLTGHYIWKGEWHENHPDAKSRKKRRIRFSFLAVFLLGGIAIFIGFRLNEIEESPTAGERLTTETKPNPASSVLTARIEPKKEQSKAAPRARLSSPLSPGNIKIGDVRTGDCSNIQIGGSGNTATTNCGPPPLKLEYSVHTLSDGEQGLFGFSGTCPVRSRIRIVPNQSVPPPVSVALDFDHPISQIATTIENVGATVGGGPYTIGLHAVSSPISPGISPHNPLVVEVCSDVRVQLISEPHLVN